MRPGGTGRDARRTAAGGRCLLDVKCRPPQIPWRGPQGCFQGGHDVAARWRDPAAFRADGDPAPSVRPTRGQALVLLAVLVVVAAGAAAGSWLLKPSKAQAF